MAARTVEPITRTGSWLLEGGYRRRAAESLELLEQRVAAYRASIPPDKTPARGPSLKTRDAVDEIHVLSDSAVLFAAMAVESFLNFYGVVRLGEDFYSRNYERLGIVQKLGAIVGTCCGQLLASDDEIGKVVNRLFERRNQLVHPKTRESEPPKLFPDATPLLPRAREAVQDMQRFFELFLSYDPDAKKWADL